MIITVPTEFYQKYDVDKPINNDIIFPERIARFFANEYNNVEPEFTNVSDETKQILKENDSHEIFWMKDYYASLTGRVGLVVYVGQDQEIHFRLGELVSFRKKDNKIVEVIVKYPAYRIDNSYWYNQEEFYLTNHPKVVILNRTKFKFNSSLNTWEQTDIVKKMSLDIPKIPIVICNNFYNGQSDSQIIKDYLSLLNRKYKVYSRLNTFSIPKLMWDAQNIQANFPQKTAQQVNQFWDSETVIAVQGFQYAGVAAKPFEIFYPSINWGEIDNDINWIEHKILSTVGMPISQSKNSAQQSGVEFAKLNAEADSNYDNKRILKSKELTQLCYLIEMMNYYYLGKGNKPNKGLKVQIPLTPSRQLMEDTIKNKNQMTSKVSTNPKPKEDKKDE